LDILEKGFEVFFEGMRGYLPIFGLLKTYLAIFTTFFFKIGLNK
jgi:hypothetical protein